MPNSDLINSDDKKWEVTQCTSTCHYLVIPSPNSGFSTRPRRCNLLDGITREHRTFPDHCAPWPATHRDAPAGAQSSVRCKGRILPRRSFPFNTQYENSKTRHEKLQCALNSGFRLLLWLYSWASKLCWSRKVSKFCERLSWTSSRNSMIWIVINKTCSSLRVSDRGKSM